MSGFGRNRDGPGRDHRLDRDRSRSASRDSRGRGRGGRGGFRGRGRGGGPRVSEKEMERKQVKDDIAKMNYEGEAELLDYRAHIAKAYDTLNINAGIERLDLKNEERDERNEIRDRCKQLSDLPLARMNGGDLNEGRKIKLKTNSYQITFNPQQRLYVYQLLELKVVAKGRAPELKKSEKRAVIQALGRNLSSRICFDGESCMIWNQEFRRQSFGRDGEIWDERRGEEFGFELHGVKRENGKVDSVQGKFIFRMDVGLDSINQFIQGQSFDVPSDCIQAVDIIVRTVPALSAKYLSKGRSAFCEIFNQDADQRNMPGGMTVWHGICQSAKISSWKAIGSALTLNNDIAYGLFMRQQLMVELVEEYEGNLPALEEKIKHLTIEVRDGPNPFYKFGQFTRRRAAETEIFMDDIHNMVDYYHRSGFKINPNHVCVETTTKTKDRSGRCKYQTFPLEHVRLVGGQRPKGLMSERTRADFIRTTAEPAPVRQAKIQQMIESDDIYDRDQLEQYGLRISKDAMDAEGTVLVTPKVYANQGQEVERKKNDDGTWHVDTFERPAKPINQNWIRVVIGMNDERPKFERYWNEFGKHLSQVGTSLGVPMGPPLFSEWLEDGVQFGAYCDHMKKKGPKEWAALDFILVCLGNDADTYSMVKVAAELNHDVMTQCVLPKTVLKNDTISLRNIFFKINKKLGGHNWRIPVPLPESPVPIMLIGISLSHAEKDSSDPSIAGFVGTTLQGAVGYKNYVDVQHPGLHIVAKDVIRRAMESLLSKYREINNGALPEKLIIYRSGGSEGSYQAILKNEFLGIREALAEMKQGYQPGITFISAMRASRQKFFAVDEKDKTGMGENVPVGTCVSGFGNGTPDSYAFHLLSHSAVGCANPTFYQILHDDNNIELQNMVNMTYALTMATQRCNKSTSHTTPVFLANLLTERARNHWRGTSLGIALRKSGFQRFYENHKLRVKTIERFQSEVFFI